MKKSKKILLRVLPVLMVMFVLIASPIFGIDVKDPDSLGGKGSTDISNVAGNIWQTISTVVQVVAIAAVVLAGVRYMFASADAKADIKKQTVILIVGAVLVFAAVPLMKLIASVSDQIINQ